MRGHPPDQLAFDFAGSEVGQPPSFTATRPLLKHRRCTALLKRFSYVRRFFPELDGRTLRVGLTRAASGMAVPGGDEIWFNPNHVSHHTIAHELVHLLQGKGDVPTGERSCDIFSLARHWTLNDTQPYYVRVPKEFFDGDGRFRPPYARVVFEVAVRAIELRGSGVRNYIQYFERALRGLKKGLPVETAVPPGAVGP